MAEHARNALANARILITRPAEQSLELANAIRHAGGTPVLFPVLEIVPRATHDILADADRLPDADLAVFVSPNAVRFGMPFGQAPDIAAIGPATARAIEAAGFATTVRPAVGFDSESLLLEPALVNVAGKHIRIIRGTSGRNLLGDTLRERGATVDYLATYTRRRPVIAASEMQELVDLLATGGLCAIIIMSVDSLRNFLAMLPADSLTSMNQVLLVTPARRVIKEAEDAMPLLRTVQAHGTDAIAIVDAIIETLKTDSGKTP